MTDSGGRQGGDASGVAAPAPVVHSQELLREVVDRVGHAFSDGEVLANLRALTALAATVEAARLGFVQELSSRPTTVGGPTGRASRFLMEGLRLSPAQARRDLAAAAAIRSGSAELPVMGAALAAGEVSREHLDVAVKTVTVRAGIGAADRAPVGSAAVGAVRRGCLRTRDVFL